MCTLNHSSSSVHIFLSSNMGKATLQIFSYTAYTNKQKALNFKATINRKRQTHTGPIRSEF